MDCQITWSQQHQAVSSADDSPPILNVSQYSNDFYPMVFKVFVEPREPKIFCGDTAAIKIWLAG